MDAVLVASERLQTLLVERRTRLALLRGRCIVAHLGLAIVTGVALALHGWALGGAVTGMLALGVAARVSAAEDARAMVALRTTVKPVIVLGAAACVLVVLTGQPMARTAVLSGTATAAAAVVLVRIATALSGVARHRGTHRRLLVGDPLALDVDPEWRERIEAQDDVRVVTIRASRHPQDDPDSPGWERRDGDEHTALGPVAPLGVVERVAREALSSGVEQVSVLPGDSWGPLQLRELTWVLEGTGIDVVVATSLSGIAPHRVDVTAVDGRLSIRIGSARPGGARAVVKSTLDRFGAAVLLIGLSPALVALGVAVRLDSRGPALFGQVRVRDHGRTFRMWKLRTMVVDAEQRRASLQAEIGHQEGGGLFKMVDDPRVTRLGKVLRRLSIDELPQLINVVKGDMSLIGPRPALPAEVATYDFAARRRLAVKPGMTGLWQVSGRSALSWEESIGLDLEYVDNWSAAADMTIAARTLKAVMSADGAY